MIHQAIINNTNSNINISDNPLCFTAINSNSTIKLNPATYWDEEDVEYTVTYYPPLQYSTDKNHWYDYTFGNVITLSSVNDTIYFINKSSTQTTFSGEELTIDGMEENAYFFFTVTGSLKISGDITTLLCSSGNITDLTSSGEYCFYRLFERCTALVNASELLLPATTLTRQCYTGMFYNCTNLISAPELVATSLSTNCYNQMFYGCSSLVTATSSIPGNFAVQGCCQYMFRGCTNLTTPPTLPITRLGGACYYGMFYDCTKLTSIPRLPATSLGLLCYSDMFRYCTQLKLSNSYSTTTPYTSYLFPSTSYSSNITNCTSNMIRNTSGSAFSPEADTQYYCNVPFNS